MWEDNAHKGQNWCKNGKANGSYVQQIEYENCQSGWVWEPGQAAIAAIGQGYVTVDAAAAHQRLHRARQRRHAVQPADRRGAGLPVGQAGAEDQPAGDQAPAGRVGDPRLHPLGAGRRGDPGHRGRARSAGSRSTRSAWRARPVPRRSSGKNATSVFASFAPCNNPKFVVVVMLPNSGYGADAAAPAVRQIWDGIYGLEGKKAALPGGKLPPGARDREGDGEAMSVGLGQSRTGGQRERGPPAAAGHVRPAPPVPAGPGVRQGRRRPVLGLAADRRHLRADGGRHACSSGRRPSRRCAQAGPRPAHLPEEGDPVGACSA